jgi:hypothetical protein
MKVKDYRNMAFESACYRTPEYIAFERACRRELKKQCAERGINIHTFHGNHFEWSAVLEKGGKFVYVSMSDVRWFDWYDNMLIRTMSHDKDWRGGGNNKCAFNEVGEYAERLFESE